jgi:probable addiction module antidote protein
MDIQTTKFDIQDYLKSAEDRAAYLEAAMDEGDATLITHALGDVARTLGMSEVAREAGITREGLYKALSDKGDPRLSTLLGVLRAMGLKLSAQAAPPQGDRGLRRPSIQMQARMKSPSARQIPGWKRSATGSGSR